MRPDPRSSLTRGRTLDHAAALYDLCQPFVMLGREGRLQQEMVNQLRPAPDWRVLDLGCGTGLSARRSATSAIGWRAATSRAR